MKSLAEVLTDVVDHRSRQGLQHELPAILLLACTGMLCGCRSLQALTAWGKRQEQVLLKTLGFPRGRAPGYGTWQRTLSQLEVASFERALQEWAEAALAAHGRSDRWQGLALDGKVLRGSRQGDLPGVHLLAVLAQELGITLVQDGVPAETNEITASLPLLAGLHLTNRVVTADALLLQRQVCAGIRLQQGHYLMVLKDNQPELHQAVQDWFEPFPPTRRAATGRSRTGQCGPWSGGAAATVGLAGVR